MLSNLKCSRLCLKATAQSLIFQRSIHGKTHYEVLKIPRTASSDQIRKAYIQRCKELHPDRNINDPENHNKMVRLNEAYQCLSKRSSKSDYDRKLSMGINITESYYPGASHRPYTPPRPDAANYGAWQQTYYGASREDSPERLSAATVARVVVLAMLALATFAMSKQRIQHFRREQIAQRERDYYRRVQEEIEREWNSGKQKTMNEQVFNGTLVLFTLVMAYLAYAYFDYQANAERLYWQEQQKSEKRSEGIKFSNSLILPFIFGLSAFFTGAVLQTNAIRRQQPIRYQESESSRKRPPGSLYATFCAIYLIVASTGIIINIGRHHYDNRAQKRMHARELNRADRIYFREGGSYPRPLRRNNRHSSYSDTEEKEISS